MTHQRTRFPEASGPAGLVNVLGDRLREVGMPSVVRIHDADHFTPDMVPLTRRSLTASIDAELALEKEWRVYVDPGAQGVRLDAGILARRAYRRLRLAPPWRTDGSPAESGARMINRLVNIELAHLHLMTQAVDSGAAWTLIVEDDARLADPTAFALALSAFVGSRGALPQPAYVNVSRSFEAQELGLSDHLSDAGPWSPGVRALSSDRPLTNTVCAVLYRSAFLRELTAQLAAIPISPVLPIDWKLNAALLELRRSERLGPGDCWFLEPAPILQGSMHGST